MALTFNSMDADNRQLKCADHRSNIAGWSKWNYVYQTGTSVPGIDSIRFNKTLQNDILKDVL